MEIKLKKGQKFKVKNVTLDERDELLDSIQYELNNDGSVKGVKMMHSTMTKWIRIGVDGDTSDEFLKTLTLEDKTAIFTEMQNLYLVGEGKASK